ncbi:MAG TPA: MoxR family ATPase, partial [Victivallales bacterium]|nr:MoxR family ATPase [Victivallales bacterium]
ENEITQSDVEKINKIRDNYSKLKNEIAKVIYGQDDVIEKILICIFSGGHALLMGVPGLAKTLTINTIAKTMNLSFSRIQFTPDLMPSDIIGTEILQEDYNEGKRFLQFIKGPVFANVILADEINRTPPKTQAALLQAMQEKSITVAGKTYELVKPFFVLATQNPIEQEGTYPLPEAQLDRFMFFIKVNYPDKEHELMIAKSNPSPLVNNIKHIISSEELIEYQELIKKIPVPEHIYDYVVRIVRETRPPLPEAPKWLKSLVNWGAGPRAVQFLILGAKARAILNGNYLVTKEDVNSIMPEVLSHRILLSFHAETENITSEDIIRRLIDEYESKQQ